jgi:hypothetical protein
MLLLLVCLCRSLHAPAAGGGAIVCMRASEIERAQDGPREASRAGWVRGKGAECVRHGRGSTFQAPASPNSVFLQ